LATRRPACGGVRARRPLRLPAPAGLAAVGFARVSSTERRRADIKSGHFIELLLYCTFDTVAHPRHFARWARPQCRIADDLRNCENAALDAVSTVNSRFIPQKLNCQLSTLTPPPFDPPQRGHPIPETFPRRIPWSRCPPAPLSRDSASTSRRVLRSVPDRVRALCDTAPTCCEHPASRVERGMAVTRHTLMDTLDKIPPSSLTDSTHTQLACRKGRVHSSPDLHA
jgi:hypothetical protein